MCYLSKDAMAAADKNWGTSLSACAVIACLVLFGAGRCASHAGTRATEPVLSDPVTSHLSNPPAPADVVYDQAENHAEQGDWDAAVSLLESRPVFDVPDELRRDWVYLHTIALLSASRPSAAFSVWRSFFSDSTESQRSFGDLFVERVEASQRLDLMAEIQTAAPWMARVAVQEAERFRSLRDLDGLIRAVRLGASIPTDDAHTMSAWSRIQTALARIENTQALALGVLVPLSGPHRAFGESVLRSLQMAKNDLKSGVSLNVVDSAGDPVVAKSGAEQLIGIDRVAAILGPVGPKESMAVVPVVEQHQVPTIVLTATLPTGEPRSFVVQGRLTPPQECFAVLQHAMVELSCQSFAILMPNNTYGQTMALAFRDAVSRSPAMVVYEDSIDTSKRETDEFRRASQKIAAEFAKRPFSALYLPMNGAMARRFVSYLNAAGLPIRINPKNVNMVQLVGSAAWSTPDIIDVAEGNTDNAIFPSVFFDGAASAASQAFVASFRARYSAVPTAFEAEVYDAGIALMTAMESAQGGSFVGDEILDGLFGMGPMDWIEGVGGRYRFESTGYVVRDVHILTVDADYLRVREKLADEVRIRSR